jgi:N-acetylmannosamine-6-phosphate 2-epimerase/N-acetylmannosamine kinase
VSEPVLAIDIGGTKILAALVAGAEVLDQRRMATPRSGEADDLVQAVGELAQPWLDRVGVVGVAATGIFDQGGWHALNAEVLAIPAGYPLAARLRSVLHRPVTTTNDAQAAAWGEHRFGAGEGRDMVFVTISTGVGGGIVAGGRLLGGIAGSIGQIADMQSRDGGPAEDHCSGRWIERAAARSGHPGSAAEVFAAAASGAEWAEAIIRTASERVAVLLRTLQLIVDPPRIVVGGGVGLAHGFLDRIERQHAGIGPRLRPRLVAAATGAAAGILGAADLARYHQLNDNQ